MTIKQHTKNFINRFPGLQREEILERLSHVLKEDVGITISIVLDELIEDKEIVCLTIRCPIFCMGIIEKPQRYFHFPKGSTLELD